ncbi:MAG TPA: hypothetical protein VNZ25_08150, partial [Candidatus Angelobacter sp.]|nr:hypothetical protein [Candidatus Angelobacter sp.]
AAPSGHRRAMNLSTDGPVSLTSKSNHFCESNIKQPIKNELEIIQENARITGDPHASHGQYSEQ